MRDAALSLREHLTSTLLALLKIPSVTGNEAALADHFERWALAHMPRLEVQRFGNSMILGEPADDRPTIALVGHLDTVPPHPSDAGPRREGDKLYGRGASDMKSGIAVAQILLDTLPLATLPFSLIFVLYDREEGPFTENGLKTLLEEVRALSAVDLAILLEPTDNTIEVGCLGSLHARLVIRGRAAHSARPWQGENAIHKAAPLLGRIAALEPSPVLVNGLSFRESMSLTLAQAGHARNVIPDRVELNLNYRFAPADDPEAACRAAVGRVRTLTAEADLDIIDLAPPGRVPMDNRFLDGLQLRVGHERRAKEAWTDVARFGLWGVDAVNFGPGTSAQAHQANEWASLEAMAHAYEILKVFLTTPPLLPVP
jgi:succinyl-diaminopimelate desuccinylase